MDAERRCHMVRIDSIHRDEKIQVPVIIADGLDVTLYASLHDVEQHLETIGVRRGGYVGYDAAGRLLDIRADDDKVIIVAAEAHPSHAAELEQALRDSLQALVASSRSDFAECLNYTAPGCNRTGLRRSYRRRRRPRSLWSRKQARSNLPT